MLRVRFVVNLLCVIFCVCVSFVGVPLWVFDLMFMC